MERLTQELDRNKFYITDDAKINQDEKGYFGDAIDKLGKLENLYEDLLASQIVISKELEKLRGEGKTRSVEFKELMLKKLNNSNIINFFKFIEI